MQVKICGITRSEDALHAATCGADFIGLVLAASPRRISLASAREIVAALPPRVQPVLVFRDAALDEVLAAVAATGAGWVQLHGGEEPAYLRDLRARRPDLQLIKAWEIAAPGAADGLRNWLDQAWRLNAPPAVLLLDAPKTGPHPGYDVLGDISRQLAARPPAVWCAGGLTPDNIAAALAAGAYDGADVAGGVEVRPGEKDSTAVQHFIACARGHCG